MQDADDTDLLNALRDDYAAINIMTVNRPLKGIITGFNALPRPPPTF